MKQELVAHELRHGKFTVNYIISKNIIGIIQRQEKETSTMCKSKRSDSTRFRSFYSKQQHAMGYASFTQHSVCE